MSRRHRRPRPVGGERYVISPDAGGGTAAWTAALARKIGDLTHQGAQVVIVSPADRPWLYTQALICRCGIHVEAVSNHFLEPDHALSGAQENQLENLGWQTPIAPHDPVNGTPNWSLTLDRDSLEDLPGAATPIATLMLSTLLEVHHVRGHDPIEVRVDEATCHRPRA